VPAIRILTDDQRTHQLLGDQCYIIARNCEDMRTSSHFPITCNYVGHSNTDMDNLSKTASIDQISTWANQLSTLLFQSLASLKYIDGPNLVQNFHSVNLSRPCIRWMSVVRAPLHMQSYNLGAVVLKLFVTVLVTV